SGQRLELDAEQEAPPAHFAHDRELADGSLELVAQARTAVANALDEPVLEEIVEHREPDRARQRRAVPRVAVLELPRAGRERVVHVLPAEHGGEREVAGAKSLSGGDDVGLDRQLLVREPATGPAHAGDDLAD